MSQVAGKTPSWWWRIVLSFPMFVFFVLGVFLPREGELFTIGRLPLLGTQISRIDDCLVFVTSSGRASEADDADEQTCNITHSADGTMTIAMRPVSYAKAMAALNELLLLRKPGWRGYRKYATQDSYVLQTRMWFLTLVFFPMALPLALRGYWSYRWYARTRRNRCRNCGYSLVGLPSARCPECGATFVREGSSNGERATRSATPERTNRAVLAQDDGTDGVRF